MLLVLHKSSDTEVPLKILDIETGEVTYGEISCLTHGYVQVRQEFKQPLKPGKKVDFIEQFNEKLLVKQKDEYLQILDVTSDTISAGSLRICDWQVHSSSITEVTDFQTPNAFIFLYENQLFLTFCESSVAVWNFRGKLITK